MPEEQILLRLHKPKKHQSSVNYVSFNHSGTALASCSSDAVVCIWNTSTFRLIIKLVHHKHEVWSMAFSATNLLVTASKKKVIVYDQNYQKLQNINDHTEYITTVVFSEDG